MCNTIVFSFAKMARRMIPQQDKYRQPTEGITELVFVNLFIFLAFTSNKTGVILLTNLNHMELLLPPKHYYQHVKTQENWL
jgi:hypothetical protein